MKSIRIIGLYRLPIIYTIFLALGFPFCSIFLVGGAMNNNWDLFTLDALVFGKITITLEIFYNYGITITSRYVLLISHDEFKIFKYEDIRYINITIGENSITGQINSKCNKPFNFNFGDVVMSPGDTFAILTLAKFVLNEKQIKRFINSLSKCEKVTINRQ